MDNQGGIIVFNDLLNDLKFCHNNDDYSVYVPDASDNDEDSIRLW